LDQFLVKKYLNRCNLRWFDFHSFSKKDLNQINRFGSVWIDLFENTIKNSYSYKFIFHTCNIHHIKILHKTIFHIVFFHVIYFSNNILYQPYSIFHTSMIHSSITRQTQFHQTQIFQSSIIITVWGWIILVTIGSLNLKKNRTKQSWFKLIRFKFSVSLVLSIPVKLSKVCYFRGYFQNQISFILQRSFEVLTLQKWIFDL